MESNHLCDDIEVHHNDSEPQQTILVEPGESVSNCGLKGQKPFISIIKDDKGEIIGYIYGDNSLHQGACE